MSKKKTLVELLGGTAGALTNIGATNYAQYNKYLNEIIASGAEPSETVGNFSFFTWSVTRGHWSVGDLNDEWTALKNPINYEGQEAVNLIAGLPAGLGLGLALASKNNKSLAIPAGLVYGTTLYNAIAGKGMEMAQESAKSLTDTGVITSAGAITGEMILTLSLLALSPVIGYLLGKVYQKYKNTKEIVDTAVSVGGGTTT